MSLDCLTTDPRGCILRVRVMPNARKSCVEDVREGRLAVRIQAPPVEGKANQAVVAWAAKALGLRKSAVHLLRGDKSREKDLLLEGAQTQEVEQTLKGLMDKQNPNVK